MSHDERDIIDLPERDYPTPRQFIVPLAVGLVLGIVAIIFYYQHWPYTLWILGAAWISLCTHFGLKILFNWRTYPWQSWRDLAHIVVLTAVLSRFIHFKYSFWLLGAGLIIYFSTFLRRLFKQY